jgi:hypothetical protein
MHKDAETIAEVHAINPALVTLNPELYGLPMPRLDGRGEYGNELGRVVEAESRLRRLYNSTTNERLRSILDGDGLGRMIAYYMERRAAWVGVELGEI